MLLDNLLYALQDPHHRRQGSTEALISGCVIKPGTTLIVATQDQRAQILKQYSKSDFPVCAVSHLRSLRGVDTALAVDNYAIVRVLEEAQKEILGLNEKIENLKATNQKLREEIKEDEETIKGLNNFIDILGSP